jgi:acyl carrier protein
VNTAETIQRFIQDELVFGGIDGAISRDTPLCDGVLDSIGLTELVSFIEERFGVRIEDGDLTADNFRSIAAIERLIDARRSS